MSSTYVERTRSLHEELEILERAMYTELGDPSTVKLKRPDQIARDQVVANLLSAHQQRTEQLQHIYEDADGSRRDEVNGMSGTGVFSSFYDQLKAIRDYHRRFPKAPSMSHDEHALLTEVLESAPDAGFTGEEAEGKFVDMHELHEM
jgi:splicing factor 3A subunit 3